MDAQDGGRTAPAGRDHLAVGIVVLTWGLALGAVVATLAAGQPFDEVPWYAERSYFVLYLLVALTTGPTAAVIVRRGPHPAGLLTALIGTGFAASAAALAWSFLAWSHPGLPGAGFAVHASGWLSAPGGFLAITVLPWLLRPDRLTPARRALAATGAAATLLITLLSATGQQPEAPANPLSLDGTAVGAASPHLVWPCLWVCAAVGLLAVGDVVRQWRREPSDSARAYGVLASAVTLMFAGMTMLQFWPTDAGRAAVQPLGIPVLAVAQVLLCLSVVVVVLRTWDGGPDIVVPRLAVWALLSSVVALLYVSAVGLAIRLLPMNDDAVRTLVVAGLALVIHPLRQWLQGRVDRLVHGAAADPVRLLGQLGRQVRGEDRRDVLPALVESVRDGLRLGRLEIVSVAEPRVRVHSGAARAQTLPEHRADLRLVVDDRHVGDLTALAAPGQRLDARTRKVLRSLSDVLALGLDLAQSQLRLQAASERLGEVRHEERRMLRRELHDSLGPALAGVGLGLAAAQRRLRHDPPGASVLLDEMRAELTRRTDDIRMLARSLLPVQLDDGDLAAALDVLATRFRGAGLDVRTYVDPAATLDTRRQIAVYHVATEALMNAYRHAQAGAVDLAVTAAPGGGVVLDVADDGRGVGEAPRTGVGLSSMRERADELGGSVVVEPRPDAPGTRVRMVLP
ncbi:sensor histidine kinase [Nocardioides nitrophenolicus]|uniref:sensor histidine kinase n=1 Tax=Nocardioides nitrophenolicus TaxID=60489 RepID=UPI001959C13F|nr:ATP-binding protein [Nocardioides nitrophenolicus]MBM7517133.1 signal transduction histidine kinase [Nocardioides nitrophenolicus]